MNKQTARKRRGSKAKAIIRTSSDRPRLVVYRSGVHTYGQIVVRGDKGDEVLVSSSTQDGELKPTLTGNKCDKATQVGELLGKRAIKQNVLHVAFDRSGYKYHGRIKALAEAARKAGLIF